MRLDRYRCGSCGVVFPHDPSVNPAAPTNCPCGMYHAFELVETVEETVKASEPDLIQMQCNSCSAVINVSYAQQATAACRCGATGVFVEYDPATTVAKSINAHIDRLGDVLRDLMKPRDAVEDGDIIVLRCDALASNIERSRVIRDQLKAKYADANKAVEVLILGSDVEIGVLGKSNPNFEEIVSQFAGSDEDFAQRRKRNAG